MQDKDKRRKQGIYPIPLKTAAELLDCSEPHLSLVLRKLRISKSLTRRYNALVAAQGGCR